MPSAAELSGLRPQSLRIPSHDGVMLNVGYFGGCGRPVLFTHYVAIGAQIVEQPIEGIIIFADVDLQRKETEIDFWRNPLLPETKRRARRARSAWSVASRYKRFLDQSVAVSYKNKYSTSRRPCHTDRRRKNRSISSRARAERI
ncbi:MAG: hypothetical protein DME67_01855 [Verrucomicrobia bacterium]|nr:MAG: hypothetical protein DME67_01855 [Verrucomicrobiota bacterium]